MTLWSDFFKLFTYATEKDPLAKRKDSSKFSGAGISQADALQTGGELVAGQGPSNYINLRQTYDMIDTTTLGNRSSRYKEYERLRNLPEIEMAMTVFADEACVSGDTLIATPHGYQTIEWLTKNKANERFLVYCYNLEKRDYTLGWAFAPRLVKKAKTVEVVLDDGKIIYATPDHRILKRNGEWIPCGELEFGDELMPFYRIPANQNLTNLRVNQFPRIFSFDKGWIHERQFVDDWKSGKITPEYEKLNRACRLIGSDIPVRQIAKIMEHDWNTIDSMIQRNGFTLKEIRKLHRRATVRKVVSVAEGPEMDVYDISVEKHLCFATDSVILHNCQKNDMGNIMTIECKNDEVRKEIEFLLLHRKMLNLNRYGYVYFKDMIVHGDKFFEIVINPDKPAEGIYKIIPLPPETMYRIETIKGKLIEFQQSKEGPDYQALARGDVSQQSDAELSQSTAIRFAPSQILHMRIGDDRRNFYPYGQSLIEPARGPAHQLRLMEDAMVVYRLCLVGNTRIRTENSYKYIKDLQINDQVYSYDQSNNTIITNVINFMNNGIKDVYKVKTKHVEITGTATHPILVNRNGIIQYVDIQNLIPKHDMIINVQRNNDKEVEIPKIFGTKWAKISDSQRKSFRNNTYANKSQIMRLCSTKADRVKQFLYSKGKALPYEKALEICDKFEINPDNLIVVSKGQYNEERIDLPKYVDEDFARLFGFLIGDGSMSKNKCQLNFTAGMDDRQNKFYANLLKKYFGKVRFEKETRSKHKQLGKYVVDSRIACKTFITLGYIHGAKNKRIPDWVHTASKNIRKAFVEGICNADGCERTTKKGTWFSTIELCNQKLIEDIKEIWSSIGLCSGKLKTRHRKCGHIIEKNRKMPSTISYSVTISENELPKYENVISVEHVGKEEVFDITVENELHNFIANGIPTHNTRAPERRVFYIDVGQLPPFKAEAFMERLKDQFRKRKTAGNRATTGANLVEERWQPPAQDEDYWVPVRPNANSRIETLPGAQNLGEIDDAVYFRNKLFVSLNFPKSYFSSEDVNATRITLSAQDVKFARMIERLQSNFEDGILDICERHLELRGFPQEMFKDLKIRMTPPSDWRELSRAEVKTARLTNAGSLKSGLLMSDYDIYTKVLMYSEEDTSMMLSRLKLQKLEDLKIQIMSQNPQLLGVGVPTPEEAGKEIGSEAGGPTPDLGAEAPPPAEGETTPPPAEGETTPPPEGEPPTTATDEIPDAEENDLKKYNLEIINYGIEQDHEDRDDSTMS
jgi:intein/homing endonuclease